MKKTPLILILDDLRSELEYIKDILVRNGFDAITSDSQEDFFHKLEHFKPDLILLDILMPGIDGYEICKQIKANKKHVLIPIIFLTALTKNKDVIKGLEYGAIDFITKPFNEEIFLLRVNSVLNQYQKNENYRLLFENMNQGFTLHKIITDNNNQPIDFEIIETNSIFLDRLGLPREQVINKRITEIFPNVKKKWIDIFGKVALGGKPVQFTDYSEDLGRYYVASIYCPKPGYAASTFNDVTEKVKIEKALKESEEKYKFIANNISDVVWRYDLNLKCKYISPSVYNLRGVTVEEAMNSKPEDTFPPESLSVIKETIKTKLKEIKNNEEQGLKPFILNLKLYKKDKSTIWTQISVSVIKGNDNKTIEILGVTRDISKQKETELALIESENRYRALFEKSKDPVLFLQNDKFIDCNKATLDVLKISSKDKLLKKKPWELSPEYQPDGRRSKDKAIEMIEIANNNGYHEFDWVHSDSLGKQIWFRVSLIKVPLKGETLLYTIWRDVSAEILLKESEAKLKKINKEKDKFISILAHDLKNSIGGSVSLFKLLESKDLDWEKRDLFISELGRNSKASYKLLQDLIKWGKATLGKESFLPKELNICEVFKKVKNLYATQILQKNISLEMRCNKNLITWADSNMLDTILRNLVSNAIKYTHKNGIISIEAVVTEKETITGVMDTGVGMPKEKADNLFNFNDLRSEPGTEGEKGNGFGLQIVKEYITIHGGKTHVKSKLGKGTTIFFTLPNKKSEEWPLAFSH